MRGVNTMTMRLNRSAGGDQDLVLHYWAADNRAIRMVPPLLLGMFAAIPLWLLFLCVNQLRILAGLWSSHFNELQLVIDPPSPWQVVWCGVALLPLTLLFGWSTLRVGVACYRSVRGTWWLLLSPTGFAVNDRLGGPRQYRWREIDKFMLVAPSAEIHDAVPAPAQTVAEVIRDGTPQRASLIVGFHYLPPGRRRPLLSKLKGSWCDRTGTQADGLVMGYWDRPFDEAVDLMNEWLARYKGA
jgi:hypothetical protein